MSAGPDFGDLERLKKYLASIRKNHLATLTHYRSDDNRGFYHQPRGKDHASLSCTATCVSSLIQSGLWPDKSKLKEGQKDKLNLNEDDVAGRLMKKPWESADLEPNNPFSLSFIVEGVLDLQKVKPDYPGADGHLKTIKDEIVPKIVGWFSNDDTNLSNGSVAIKPYPPSAYLTQLSYRVLDRCNELNADLKQRVLKWSRLEISRQISLISSGSRVGDPAQLAYALIIAVSAMSDENTTPADKEVFDYALALFFGSQREDGSWPLSRPLFHYPQLGNAHCFEYELLTQMLLCLPLRDSLLQYIPNFERAALLLQKTVFDLDTTSPGRIMAWASGHHPQVPGPESWSTASVYHFAFALDRLVAEAIRIKVFEALGALYTAPTAPTPIPQKAGETAFATDFLDADLTDPSTKKVVSLRDTIATRFVYPIAKEASLVAQGGRLSDTTPMSAILFGPPGTSKTQLAKKIGKFLNWPLLAVDPSYLVQEGLDKIQAMANRLFTMLATAEQIVVLLDEFDEMGRDRSRTDNLLSRFITTAMLPKLAEINEQRKIVFLLATNYVSGFDAAFSRGGRFDMLVQVMPPNTKAKLGFKGWEALQRLGDFAKGQGTDSEAAFNTQLGELTFLETEQLVKQLGSGAGDAKGMAALKAIYEVCTLEKENESDKHSKGKGGTKARWRDSCKADAELVRLPSA